MDGQGQDGDAEAESRGDERFADAAGNGHGLAGLDVEDAERADHAADRPQEAQERRHGDDDAQIVETAAQFGHEDARLHFDEGLDVRTCLMLKDILQNEGQAAAAVHGQALGLVVAPQLHLRVELFGKGFPGVHVSIENRPFDANVADEERTGQEQVHDRPACLK